MRPEFAAAVDPIFMGAIELVQRIERGSEDAVEIEHASLLNLFDRADIVLGASQQWQFARYAIAVWIDEILLTAPWKGSDWWRNHILEVELFQSRICNERFFELAKEASAFRCKDALEVFYNCVLLGFRGMYAVAEQQPSFEPSIELPKNIEQWMERTARMLDGPSFSTSTEATFRSIQGAPPLQARYQAVWWSVAAMFLVLLNTALYQYIQSTR